MSYTFGILTVSDTRYSGKNKDFSGPMLEEYVTKHLPCAICLKHVIPDVLSDIENALIEMSNKCDVILTTGGTGFSPRDVTPEATRKVIEKEAPGLAYAMITRSLAVTELAMLSRAVCGIRNQTLIINLPGSVKGAVECLSFIKDSIPHAIALIKRQPDFVHEIIQKVPKPSGEILSKSNVKLGNVASRERSSPFPIIEVEKAKNLIQNECHGTLETEILDFHKSLNRVLAEDIYALEPVPPFRASMKDGYAVRSTDGAGVRQLKQAAAAGDDPLSEEIRAREVVRISTGAPVPAGADAVVQVENTVLCKKSPDGREEATIEIRVRPIPGQDIREIGSDINAGALVLKRSTRISPAYVGVLAMLGKTKVKVFKRPRVGVISTGNELVEPNEEIKLGKIRDCNRYTLMAELQKYGYEAMDYGAVKDDPDALKYVLDKAFRENDFVVSSGGVSMGEFDLLKEVLVQDFDAMIHFGRVNMKPGKPTTFATLLFQNQRKFFFGLPGNPVSCGVTCLLFVIPILRFFERDPAYEFPSCNMTTENTVLRNKDTRPEYHRVQVKVVSNTLYISSTGDQISSRLNSFVGANGLAIVPGNSTVEVGCAVKTILFDNNLLQENVQIDGFIKKPK